MTIHAITVLSDVTATRLTPNGMHSGMDITIQNVDGSAFVYLGGEGVTASSYGYRLAPGTAWSIELPGRDALYAITDIDESQVAVLKTNLETGN
jgi:hypothetical protein